MNASRPVVSLAFIALIAGCEPATPAEAPKRKLSGSCSCTCQVNGGSGATTWNNVYTAQPDDVACVAVCGQVENGLSGGTCRSAFTATPEWMQQLRPPDSDADGVEDSQDRCVLEGGPASNGGCPTPPVVVVNTTPKDSDDDGIPDESDRCPKEPETKNSYLDSDGCPDEIPAAVAELTGVIEGVVFKPSSAELDPKSFELLRKAVDVFKKNPDVRVEISGHTDNAGKAEANTNLSRKRAESVMAWLVKHGLPESRFEAVGFGPSKPVASNDTDVGRAKNRRVEFRLIQ